MGDFGMTWTGYHEGTSGETYYAKAKPLDAGTWSAGVVSMPENGSTGSFSASTLVDDTPYNIYLQAGGSPASGDTKVAMLDAPADCGASAGTGARTVTVTVQDGDSNPIEGARVRLTAGAISAIETTNASGVAPLAVDDATYAVAVTKTGYSGVTASLVVDGDKPVTYSLTALVTSPPTTPGTLIGQMITLDEQGAIEVGVEISIQITAGPGDAGVAYDSKVWTVTSDSNGLVEFDGIVAGATYSMWRGCGEVGTFTAPETGSTFDVDELIGEELAG